MIDHHWDALTASCTPENKVSLRCVEALRKAAFSTPSSGTWNFRGKKKCDRPQSRRHCSHSEGPLSEDPEGSIIDGSWPERGTSAPPERARGRSRSS